MSNIFLITALLALTGLCGLVDGDSTANKPLTVDELRGIQKDKPEEFKAKYDGKKVVVVGRVSALPFDYPGAYETLGYQVVRLEANGDFRSVECQVTEAEGTKFKGMKVGDVATVTGTVKANEVTMDLLLCSKAAAADTK
jgi:hypothetical protein